MLHRIPCFCDNVLSEDIPEEINLDTDSQKIDEIINGTFLNFTCPVCGKKHKPEFPIKITWPSKKVWFDVFTELDRGEFYRRKKEASAKGPLEKVTVIGYPELVERLLVYKDDLEPVAVESIKYFLHLKADENYPNEDIEIWYSGLNPENSTPKETLEFHIHGIRKDEVAVMKAPFSFYEKTLKDYKKHPKNDIFSALRVRSYLSVKNTMRPEVLK